MVTRAIRQALDLVLRDLRVGYMGLSSDGSLRHPATNSVLVRLPWRLACFCHRLQHRYALTVTGEPMMSPCSPYRSWKSVIFGE